MEERELNELRHLKKEIRYQIERVRRLEEKATSMTQIIGGIPACKGITDRVAEYAPQIAHLKTLIQNNIRWCLHLQYKIESFIESIEESEIRQIFRLRYLEGKTWKQIAFAMTGAGDGSTQYKQHKEYLRKRQREAKKAS